MDHIIIRGFEGKGILGTTLPALSGGGGIRESEIPFLNPGDKIFGLSGHGLGMPFEVAWAPVVGSKFHTKIGSADPSEKVNRPNKRARKETGRKHPEKTTTESWRASAKERRCIQHSQTDETTRSKE
jgi:hypothetical protein